MFLLLFVVNDEKIVSSNNQWAQDQLASIDFTSSLMFVLSILRLFRNAIELQTVSQKCLMNSVLHFYVCLLSLLSFKMVLMTLMLVLMEVCFSLLYAEWHIWIPKSVIECWLKCEKKKKKKNGERERLRFSSWDSLCGLLAAYNSGYNSKQIRAKPCVKNSVKMEVANFLL